MIPVKEGSVPIIVSTVVTSFGKSAPAISAAATATARSLLTRSHGWPRAHKSRWWSSNSARVPSQDTVGSCRRRRSRVRSRSFAVYRWTRIASRRPAIRHSQRQSKCWHFLAEMRRLAGGKPVGFKLCVGHPWQVLALIKAMLETSITPDFIVVDGTEGGTGAAPLEFMDHLGMPLRDGLDLRALSPWWEPTCATGSGSAHPAKSPRGSTWRG